MQDAIIESPSATESAPRRKHSPFRQALFIIALVYAALAALHTLTDFDLGWQMATGRWVLQHHAVPSTDVLSYTVPGHPWVYPVLSGILFYVTYLAGGYKLLSALSAIVCLATTALLLRRGSAVTALIGIFAVPALVVRSNVRADLFTLVLFAAFLSILWENLDTGKARLWLLPVLMAFWVNLHLGFLFGLVLCAAYVAIELLSIVLQMGGTQAASRLRAAWPWLTATLCATLLNPWGWGIYGAIARQESATAQHATWIGEWTSTRFDHDLIIQALSLRNPVGYIFWLVLIAAVAIVMAIPRKQFGAILLLAGSSFYAIRYIRFHAIFACVLVIVGGSILTSAFHDFEERWPERNRRRLSLVVVLLAATLVGVRSADLISNQFYLATTESGTFGLGLSWWFPERAADFILRNNVPGQIFNPYDVGGYVAWKLGTRYPDYIDGRAIPFGFERLELEQQLVTSPPNSPLWRDEADRYNINAMIIPIARYNGLQYFPWLNDFCRDTEWRPVYLDEVSAVFVRNTPQTEDFIRQHAVNCSTIPLPAAPVLQDRAGRFNQWANAAAVLAELGRNREALAAIDNALAIVPNSGVVHFTRANILLASRDLKGAEKEFLIAAQLEPNPGSWQGLAMIYEAEGRTADAQYARKRVEDLRMDRPH